MEGRGSRPPTLHWASVLGAPCPHVPSRPTGRPTTQTPGGSPRAPASRTQPFPRFRQRVPGPLPDAFPNGRCRRRRSGSLPSSSRPSRRASYCRPRPPAVADAPASPRPAPPSPPPRRAHAQIRGGARLALAVTPEGGPLGPTGQGVLADRAPEDLED